MERTSVTRALILRILGDLDEGLYATRLVKLVYLVDYLFFRQRGRTATGLAYEWDDFGPNAVGHRIIKEAHALANDGLVSVEPASGGEKARHYRSTASESARVEPMLEAIIRDVIRKYGTMSLDQLKAASKQTAPFKTAKQGERLVMRKDPRPAPEITRDDWDRHLLEKSAGGGKSIADLRAEYDLIEADS